MSHMVQRYSAKRRLSGNSVHLILWVFKVAKMAGKSICFSAFTSKYAAERRGSSYDSMRTSTLLRQDARDSGEGEAAAMPIWTAKQGCHSGWVT
jgi:hypothetical protein